MMARRLQEHTLATMAKRHSAWMRVHHYAAGSVDQQEMLVGHFVRWCEERDIDSPADVSRAMLQQYQKWLYSYRKANGKPLVIESQYAKLGAVRAFFRWLVKTGALSANPASDLEMPRVRKGRLPRGVLTRDEVEHLLSQPDVNEPLGLRDRAMLEVLYSTGVRRAELASLLVTDLDEESGTLLVREGKGRKDRVVPIGERAMRWLDKYLCEVRPRLVRLPDDGRMFVSREGGGFHVDHVGGIVKRYVKAAHIGKRGACHMLRHSMATLMLEGGADVRYIQEMLGHRDLSSTQIYTHVSIQRLKQVHDATHPGAKLRRRATNEA